MIVVADTSPVNYLVLIGHIDLLPRLFGRVLIPPAVCEELLHDRTPKSVQEWFKIAPAWLEKRTLSHTIEPDLELLGNGEKEAITLARELNADRIIVDDAEARLAASRRNIHAVGTLGILREGARAGLLELADAVSRLQQTNFYAAPNLVRLLLEEEVDRLKRSI